MAKTSVRRHSVGNYVYEYHFVLGRKTIKWISSLPIGVKLKNDIGHDFSVSGITDSGHISCVVHGVPKAYSPSQVSIAS